jgi:predicted lipoprotein
MKRFILLSSSIAFTFLVMIISCKKGATSTPNTGDSTNVTAKDSTLINIGNNIIIAQYQSLSIAVTSLDSAIIDFTQSPDATKLLHVQAIFKTAYVARQYTSAFDGFGPAMDITLRSIDYFPSNTTKVDANIAGNITNVTSAGNTTAKGFPAIDYLLFGSDNAIVLANFTTDASASSRKNYLNAVSADIKSEVNATLTAWVTTGGNYITQFSAAPGSDINSSSYGLVVNQMAQDIDILKQYKIAIPLGLTGGGIQANQLEAFYSGISAQLIVAQLQSLQNIYLGKSVQGVNGLGLDDYLVKINAQYHGHSLNDTIQSQFNVAIAKMQAVNDPLSTTIQTNTAALTAGYTEVQKLLVLLKSDMTSAMGILITFEDNDGD